MDIWINRISALKRKKNQSDRTDPNDESEKMYQEILNGSCLPETIINKYMELITKFSPNTLYAFNTNFFTALSDHGYSRIHRWTKNVDIFSKERLFIPIYIKPKRMWSLINVNFQDRSIRYYDSVGSGYRGGMRYQKLILKYLKLEYLMRKQKFFCTTRWKYINVNNLHYGFKFWDSGIFVCLVAHHFARNTSKDAKLTITSKSVGSQENVKEKLILQLKKNSLKILQKI
ncbi:sentrin-specific protease 1-like [Acyrthosiphon pisum]|uniref:Ubiquitin-like protease family profile domain-containing protein n=1 Tax=Acyrthosiphon pisum TaxID=7029 RepID=A0A8R1WC17_ACYPI|nr:sentrin-specific protease 1-like [Acyrthosiphon pisum]XP_016663272.1 sentrin-specific protease 1-like [Acyrthosiphon pisum]|eukprot:XP_003247341.1 PREDICTED: sentrin-specific protease 1-like [Acyrthosiphon pisum]